MMVMAMHQCLRHQPSAPASGYSVGWIAAEGEAMNEAMRERIHETTIVNKGSTTNSTPFHSFIHPSTYLGRFLGNDHTRADA